MELILASSSPRRSQLLGQAGFIFRVIHPPEVEEQTSTVGLSAVKTARTLALAKADSVGLNFGPGVIIAADTVVSLDDQIIGKARDREHARQILRALSGSNHQVISALAMKRTDSGKTLVDHDTTELTMTELCDQEIEQYLQNGPWQGKAGAYAIQKDDAFITNIKGSFSNVVGLGVELFEKMLGDLVSVEEFLELKGEKD